MLLKLYGLLPQPPVARRRAAAGRRRRARAPRARPRSGRENAGAESTPPPGEPTSPWKAVTAAAAAGADAAADAPARRAGRRAARRRPRLGFDLPARVREEPFAPKAARPRREDVAGSTRAVRRLALHGRRLARQQRGHGVVRGAVVRPRVLDLRARPAGALAHTYIGEGDGRRRVVPDGGGRGCSCPGAPPARAQPTLRSARGSGGRRRKDAFEKGWREAPAARAAGADARQVDALRVAEAFVLAERFPSTRDARRDRWLRLRAGPPAFALEAPTKHVSAAGWRPQRCGGPSSATRKAARPATEPRHADTPVTASPSLGGRLWVRKRDAASDQIGS